MDTMTPRDKAEQPWCDSNSNAQDTDNLLQQSNCGDTGGHRQADFTEKLSLEVFYTGKYCFDNNEWEDDKPPYWTVKLQESSSVPSLAKQFRMPHINVQDIECQNGDGPYTNPGGLLSRCGDDLTVYVDGIVAPPDNPVALSATADATLRSATPDQNFGGSDVLQVGPGHAQAFVVRFSADRIRRFREDGESSSATLRLGVAAGHASTRVEIGPLEGDFVEGRATLQCAEDADTGNQAADCRQAWAEPIFPDEDRRWRRHHERRHQRPVHYDRRQQLVSWDVTEDVAGGYSAWLIRTHHPRLGVYYPSEGAAALHELFRAPTLLLERDTDEAAVWDDHYGRDGGRWKHRGRHHRRWRDARFDEHRAD